MNELPDTPEALEAKEPVSRIPLGWWALFWGIILWGVYYTWTYTPALGGWSQSQDVEGGGASLGTNLLATIAFTAIPTAAAIAIVLSQRRRKG